jgi:hypothetical protein
MRTCSSILHLHGARSEYDSFHHQSRQLLGSLTRDDLQDLAELGVLVLDSFELALGEPENVAVSLGSDVRAPPLAQEERELAEVLAIT